MGVLSGLEPSKVFEYFEKICSIPHPSYDEARLSDFCMDFAKSHGLEAYKDSLGNVIIIKDAAKGYEEKEPIILQGHLDMVCEKDEGANIDFSKDGLSLKVDGDYIYADGTTLGADDGIAIAYALAILEAKDLSHPRIEAVFTVSEEVGMEGAAYIDLSRLKGHRLINIDSEEEGHILSSCAGGCRADISLGVNRADFSGVIYDIFTGGLLGGHSGTEIDKHRANANILLGRLLLSPENDLDYSIISMEGGLKDNAIPRQARAKVIVGKNDEDSFLEALDKMSASLKAEYAVSDLSLDINIQRSGEGTGSALDKESLRNALALINVLPNGVQDMSANIDGLVETSLNLGVMELSEDGLKLRYALRSSVESKMDCLEEKMRLICQLAGADMLTEGKYSAWEYKSDSPLREKVSRVYKELYGKEPIIEAIHAGVECGLISGKISDLDAVSLGPDIIGAHTPGERLSISSAARVWEFLVRLLSEL